MTYTTSLLLQRKILFSLTCDLVACSFNSNTVIRFNCLFKIVFNENNIGIYCLQISPLVIFQLKNCMYA
jgi:hypothetical protein